ncbi:MAG: dephospho-CoA kinase [Dehalococcoidia bacterium]|jgi:dephospho-CoA kinase|nr:dephospho-CoA kinase [Dehalococcoidia bacterium]
MPLVIGVTGSIATGKTGLCEHLVERWGAIHSDADKVVHRMFDPGKPGFDNAVKEFGDEIVGDDGYIDRKKVGAIVFGNPEAMGRWTRAIGNIADEIKSVIDGWRETLDDDQVAIMEAVNLIEAGYSGWCEQTWLAAAENDTAMRRMMARDNFNEDEAKQRLSSQRSWEDRAPASDHVFHNDGTLEDLMTEVDAEMERVVGLHKAGTLPKSVWFDWREKNPSPQRRPEAGSKAGDDA